MAFGGLRRKFTNMADADSETPEEKLAFLKKHGVVVETPVLLIDPPSPPYTWRPLPLGGTAKR